MRFVKKIWPSHKTNDKAFLHGLKKITGFTPKSKSFYIKAFTHRSNQEKDSSGNSINYERLEFLGDALLGAVVANYIFMEVPEKDEGYLTQMRSKIVSRSHLNMVGKQLGLIDYLKSNIPVERFGNNIHGNLFEALTGAVFLDKGYVYCEQFIYKTLLEPHVNLLKLEGKIISYKSILIEWCQKQRKHFEFKSWKDEGNDPVSHFSAQLIIAGKTVAKARETSKKKAEEKVSKRAYFALQSEIEKAESSQAI